MNQELKAQEILGISDLGVFLGTLRQCEVNKCKECLDDAEAVIKSHIKLWNTRPSDVKMSEARAMELTKEHGFESDNLTHNAFVLYESDVVKLLMEHGKEKV